MARRFNRKPLTDEERDARSRGGGTAALGAHRIAEGAAERGQRSHRDSEWGPAHIFRFAVLHAGHEAECLTGRHESRLEKLALRLLVDVLAADAVALEGIHRDPGHLEEHTVAGGYRQPPAAHAERAGHGGGLEAELTALIGG
jgi:hypothetical protein